MILLKYHFQPFHQQRSVHTLEGHPLDSLELRGSHSAALHCQKTLWTVLCIEGYFRWGHLFEECSWFGSLSTAIQTCRCFFGWALRFGGGFGKEEFICMTHKVTGYTVLSSVFKIIKDSLHTKQKQAVKHLPKSDFSPLICCPHCCFFFSKEIKKENTKYVFSRALNQSHSRVPCTVCAKPAGKEPLEMRSEKGKHFQKVIGRWLNEISFYRHLSCADFRQLDQH